MNYLKLEHDAIYRGELVLVNAEHPLRAGEGEALVCADARFPDIRLRREVATALQKALRAIGAGDAIVPVSGARSLAEQTQIYDTSLAENGAEFTRKYVALPNHSEHQTGLAIDLGKNQATIDFIRPEFPYDGICGEFRAIAHHYGFVERYAKEKEAITGIAHEPWHFRYVGTPHARLMREMRLSLEEYIALLKIYSADYPLAADMETDVFFVRADANGACIAIPEDATYRISGNNVDGFVATVRRARHA